MSTRTTAALDTPTARAVHDSGVSQGGGTSRLRYAASGQKKRAGSLAARAVGNHRPKALESRCSNSSRHSRRSLITASVSLGVGEPWSRTYVVRHNQQSVGVEMEARFGSAGSGAAVEPAGAGADAGAGAAPAGTGPGRRPEERRTGQPAAATRPVIPAPA